MRQLTASQKIAVLENRVAQLEKQAFISGIFKKVENTLTPLKSVIPEASKLVDKTRKSPKALAKEYSKSLRDRNFQMAMKELRKESGGSPTKQIAQVIATYKSGGFEPTARTASMRRRASFVATATAFGVMAGLSAAIVGTLFIIGICVDWISDRMGRIKRGLRYMLRAIARFMTSRRGLSLARALIYAIARASSRSYSDYDYEEDHYDSDYEEDHYDSDGGFFDDDYHFDDDY